MELLFVTVIGASISLGVRYLVPGRQTHGALLVPAVGAAATAAVWAICVWLGLTFDGGWIWVIALVLGPLGPQVTLAGLYAGFLVGALAGVVLSLARLIDRRSFAFGQYLVLGAVVGATWGPALYGS